MIYSVLFLSCKVPVKANISAEVNGEYALAGTIKKKKEMGQGEHKTGDGVEHGWSHCPEHEI